MSEYNDEETQSNNNDNASIPNSNHAQEQSKINLEKNSTESYQSPEDFTNTTDGFSTQDTYSSENNNNDSADYTQNYTNNNYYSTSNALSTNDQNAKNLAIASLVCGIVSLVFSCCCGCFSLPTGIAALITGFMSNYDNGQKDGMAIAGIICAIVGCLSFVGIIIFKIVTGTFSSVFQSLSF